ncbi:metallophosphoesterase [Cohnella suwonensis]|uniref:Metallophosphoesterase n=1 Tax=Cohnella suwonensis TaxID=696072 RepID=A0ABW0LNW8_9BACL
MKLKTRFAIMFAVIFVILAGLTYYLGWNITYWLASMGVDVDSAAFWIPFVVFAYGYLIGRLPLPSLLKPVFRLLKVLGSFYIFLMEIGLLLALAADAVGIVVGLAGYSVRDYAEVAGYVVWAIVVASLAVGSRNAWSPIVRTFDLEIDKRPKEGASRVWTVAVASDIHLGNVVGRRHLRRLVDRVNAMKPDLILLPGDVIDDSVEPFLRNRMSELLAEMKSTYGVYAVLGNHEYYGGHVDQYIEEMDRIGIRVMRDETAIVADALYVAGRKDKTAESADPNGRMPTAALLAGLDKSKPILLLDHQPTQFAEAAAAGADVLLSGHTHRGQFAPNHLFTRRLFELDWGYMLKEAMHVVVSSGFGSWGPPIRLGSRSEIIRLNIRLS